MITTTLARIRACAPCETGWRKLLAGLGKKAPDDEPLPYAEIVRICGIEDALWACRAEPQYEKEWRLFAVACARRVQHLMADPISVAALDVAERYALGHATDSELRTAWAAALDAALAAARDAAREAALDAALAAALDAAREAAREAAWAAAWGTAWAAARAAARDAARAAEREWQTQEFLRVVGGAA